MSVGLQVRLAWAYFEHRRFLDGQTVVVRDGEKLIARFRESDIANLFAALHSFGNELQSKGRLPRAGFSLDQIEVSNGETTTQHIVETRTSGTTACNRGRNSFVQHGELSNPILSVDFPASSQGWFGDTSFLGRRPKCVNTLVLVDASEVNFIGKVSLRNFDKSGHGLDA